MRSQVPPALTDQQSVQLDALLEEYRAMYGLALFRLEALDRRVPVAGATLAAFVGSVTALPVASRAVVLVGVPVAAIWLLRVTVNHARSFEDALRRIEWIERRVNLILHADVLGFQSHHPSRGHAVGGRTGRECIIAVLVAGLLMVSACLYLFDHTSAARWATRSCYRIYAGSTIAYLCICAINLLRYRYEPQPALSGKAE